MPLKLLQADIVDIRADAIVCAANNYLQYDRFGASGALFRHADAVRLEEACRQIGYCKTGSAVITSSFGLPCRHLIHTVGPVWQDGNANEERLLHSCYVRSLDLAKEHGLNSIAFPLISAGARGYPREQAISVATSAIGDWLMHNDSDMTVFLTLFREPVGERYREIYSYIEQTAPELSASIRPPTPDSPATDEDEFPFDLNDSERSLLFQDISNLFGENYPLNESRESRSSRPSAERLYREAACERIAEDRCFSAPPPAANPSLGSMPREERASSQSHARKVSKAPEREQVVRDLMRHDESSAGILSRLRNLMQKPQETFRDMLLRLIDEKGLSDPEVYKRANLDRRLFSKIRSNPDYQPTKNTVLALCIALQLNLDQTTDLLRLAGFALSPTSKSDLIVQYFIDREIYNIHAVNGMLFEFEQKLLGAQ